MQIEIKTRDLVISLDTYCTRHDKRVIVRQRQDGYVASLHPWPNLSPHRPEGRAETPRAAVAALVRDLNKRLNATALALGIEPAVIQGVFDIEWTKT